MTRRTAVVFAALCTLGVHEAFAQAEFFPIDGGSGATVSCQTGGYIERTGRLFGSSPTTVTACTLGQDGPVGLTPLAISVYCKAGFLIQFHPGTARLKYCVLAFDTNYLVNTADAQVSCKAGLSAEFNTEGRLLVCNGPPSIGGSSTPPARQASGPPGAQGAPDYAPICRSAMTAIQRSQQSTFGPQAQVRIAWVRPFTYDEGDCVGGYTLWVKRPEDPKEWSPLTWNADTGAGRVPVRALVQQYATNNPDLQWTPPTSESATSASRSPDYTAICRSAMTAIQRAQQKVFGPQAQVRIAWARPLTYDNGDCVGGYTLWVKRPEDPKEWSPLAWNADTGAGRVPVNALVQQYQRDNPELQWTP